MFLDEIMFKLYLLHFLGIFLEGYCARFDDLSGWGYLNLHCRDNDNKPIEWWYIYKPSSDVGPYFEFGRNFSFMTPDTAGKWYPSRRFITANLMLQHTLSPLFRPTYTDYLAVFAYHERQPDSPDNGPPVLDILMADEVGAVWIRHTIPGFPDLNSDRPIFPDEELRNGHMIMCLSISLDTANKIFTVVNQARPKVIQLKIPKKVQSRLSEWRSIDEGDIKERSSSDNGTLPAFKSKWNSLGWVILAHGPGDQRGLYKSFARRMGIVLDVYGIKDQQNICNAEYGIRNIDSICLKVPGREYNIKKQTDKMVFAVSATTRGQRHGKSRQNQQYWTCTGNAARQSTAGLGGLILCVRDYDVREAFNNLKIKEPVC